MSTAPVTEYREIVLDTETTGIAWENGHKIIEIGAIEMINRQKTGRTFHAYLDPQRDIDEDATRIHGWDRESLIVASNGQTFKDIAKDFFDFIKGSTIVAHNAPFDTGHIDAELRRIGWPELKGFVKVTDTLKMAGRLYPGRRNNLDSLCKRLNVDNSSRTFHGALLDAEILSDVYLIMTTQQNELIARSGANKTQPAINIGLVRSNIEFTPILANISSRLRTLAPASDNAHGDMMARIQKACPEMDVSPF